MRHDDELAERIAQFKGDPEKLRQANEFVDQLIQQAKKEAELKKQKERSKFGTPFDTNPPQQAKQQASNTLVKAVQATPVKQATPPVQLTNVQDNTNQEGSSEPKETQDTDSGNLKRRLGRARGLVLRMFDALCNCTQTAAAAARTTARNNPFTKR